MFFQNRGMAGTEKASAESTGTGENEIWKSVREGRNYSQPEVRSVSRVASTCKNWVWDLACRVAASQQDMA